MHNTTVVIMGNLFNASTGNVVRQAFSSGTVAVGWSFYAWTVDAALLEGARSAGVNVSLSMVYLTGSQANVSSSASTALQGPVVTVAKAVAALPELAKAPTGPALYIGLPAVLAFVIVVLAGTFLWNRHRRQIGLGNIMSRSRFGPLAAGRRKGYGIGKSRRQRTAAATATAASVGAIHLDDRPDRFRDNEQSLSPPDRPRRDSDALGSLAGSLVGTPTNDRFDDVHHHHHRTTSGSTPSTGNAFRDELARQQRSG